LHQNLHRKLLQSLSAHQASLQLLRRWLPRHAWRRVQVDAPLLGSAELCTISTKQLVRGWLQRHAWRRAQVPLPLLDSAVLTFCQPRKSE
jgi:hypothetical protein